MQRLHFHLGEEGQRALAAHDGMGDDVEGIVIGHQRTNIETRHVLDGVFLTDAVGQGLVGPHTVAKVLNLADEFGMRLAEFLAATLAAGIEHSSVGKHQTGGDKHAVAIGMYATVHARGIVTDDTSHHSRADGSRIGRKHPTERLQDFIHASAHNSRLQTDRFMVVGHFILFPVLAGHYQDGIAHRLTGQGCSCSTESEGKFILMSRLHDSGQFLLILRAQNNLGNIAVETGIRAPRKRAQFICINTRILHESFDFFQELLVVCIHNVCQIRGDDNKLGVNIQKKSHSCIIFEQQLQGTDKFSCFSTRCQPPSSRHRI